MPRFLLKYFTKGKKPKIYVYDKANDYKFKTNIKNIAAEDGFYDLEVDNSILTLEPGLAHLEANTSGIIKKLNKEKRVKTLDEHEVAILSVFLAVQFVRTKDYRLRFEHLGKLFSQKLRDMGASEENIKEITKPPLGMPEDKLIGLMSVAGAMEFVPYFLNKAWVLFETTYAVPFYISDNPITLHNEIDHRPYGNLGLGVKGIEIYLPISSTLCLGLLCPSIAEKFKEAYYHIKTIDQKAPGLADIVIKNAKAARAFCEGLFTGSPIRIIENNVTMINSLQVMFSSRFVYCETDSFDLVKRMIKDNQKYRESIKPVIS